MSSKIDGAIERAGALGRFQWIQVFFAAFASLACALQVLALVFHATTPDHRCSLPAWPNDTYQPYSDIHNESVYQWIPKDEDGQLDSCRIYASNSTNNTVECTEYVFDDSVFWGTSLNMRFGMLCSSAYIGTTVKVVFTVGQLVGAIVVGFISDRFGRRPALIGCMLVGSVAGVIASFSIHIAMFAALRFLMAGCFVGAVLVAHVIVMEVVGPSCRTYAVAAKAPAWPIGTMLLSVFAYYIQDWNWFQLAISIPGLLCALAMIRFVSETPHFLVTKGRHEQAEALFKNMADMNGKTLPDDLMEQLKEDEEAAVSEKLREILHAPVLLKRVAIFFYLWIVAGVSFYGLSLNVTNLLGDVYINNVISAAAELLNAPMTLLSQRLGRKPLIMASLLIGGLSLLASAVMGVYLDPEKYGIAMILVYMIGKAGIACVFLFDFFWSSEMFPSTLRTSLVAICSLVARFGTILSPVIVDLSNQVDTVFGPGLGSLIFGITMVIGGLLAIPLPETNKHKMPETIAEANVFRTDREQDTSDKMAEGISSKTNLNQSESTKL